MSYTQSVARNVFKQRLRMSDQIISRFLGVLAGGVALVTTSVLFTPVQAVPRRIILLRHAEKTNSYALCELGLRRSIALRDHYLGQNATNDSVLDGQTPAAILGITLHTLETATPTAASWNLPITMYAVTPGLRRSTTASALSSATQLAAGDVLSNPEWHDRVVLMVWEHHQIASRPKEGRQATLRQLLNLGHLPDVPEKWHGKNYDYFWIIDFEPDLSKTPVDFRLVKQVYPSPFNTLPHNGWGDPLPGNFPSTCQR